MSSDTSRGPKTDYAPSRDRDWKPRDAAPHIPGSPTVPFQSQPESSGSGGGSLRSRISDKEVPRSQGPVPSNSYRADPPSHKDDDRDSSRKRTVSGECF